MVRLSLAAASDMSAVLKFSLDNINPDDLINYAVDIMNINQLKINLE